MKERRKDTDKRQMILDVTEHMLITQGMCAVTMGNIAKQVGCAKGTLYTYFNSKDDILLALCEEQTVEELKSLCLENIGSRALKMHIEDIIGAMIRYYRRFVPLVTTLFADVHLLQLYRQNSVLAAMPKQLLAYVQFYLQEEQRLGRLDRQLDIASIASLILGSCFHFVFHQFIFAANCLFVSEQSFIAQMAWFICTYLLCSHSEELYHP